MRHADDLETTRQAFAESLTHQQRSRAQENDLQMRARGGILIPQPLDDFRPARHFLSLVQNEHRMLSKITQCQEQFKTAFRLDSAIGGG